MGFFSVFKTPGDDTVEVLCNTYKNKLRSTKDSKEAFVQMAKESYNNLKKHGLVNNSSPEDTYEMLGGKGFQGLSKNHIDNKDSIEYYLFQLVILMRSDYYGSMDTSKYEKLSALIAAK